MSGPNSGVAVGEALAAAFKILHAQSCVPARRVHEGRHGSVRLTCSRASWRRASAASFTASQTSFWRRASTARQVPRPVQCLGGPIQPFSADDLHLRPPSSFRAARRRQAGAGRKGRLCRHSGECRDEVVPIYRSSALFPEGQHQAQSKIRLSAQRFSAGSRWSSRALSVVPPLNGVRVAR